jgi:hypothetical protein
VRDGRHAGRNHRAHVKIVTRAVGNMQGVFHAAVAHPSPMALSNL